MAEKSTAIDFEKELGRLKEISEKMGSGELPLEESVKLYTEAVGLSKKLDEYIKKAKLKIEELEKQ